MAFASAQVTVATTGYTPLIVQGTSTGEFLNVNGAVGDELPCIVQNQDPTNPIYIGGLNVTSTNGFELIAGAALPIKTLSTDATTLCAVATGAPVVVGVLLGRQ
jgi:hypothetical protein